ncbi:MAG: tetratricopeptide repeat protein [Oleiphilaceae bacterium]|nr:tetratricopeptide repeat protein [Oleiphilaceae bacterium]
MKLIYKAGLILLSIVLTACGGLSKKEQQRLDTIEQLNQVYQSEQNNPTFLLKRAREVEALAMSQGNQTLLMQALADYQKVLAMDPANNSLRYKVYNILFSQAMSTGQTSEEMTQTYAGFDPQLKTEVNPPALARYFWLTGQSAAQPDEQALKQTIHQAMAQSPSNPTVLHMAAQLFDYLEQPAIALLFAKRAYQYSNQSTPFRVSLASQYNHYITRNACPYEYPKQLDTIATLLQPELRKETANPRLLEEAVVVYERLNALLLWFESAKALNTLQHSFPNRAALAEAYAHLGLMSRAREIYGALMQESEYAHYRWAMLLREMGQFDEARQVMSKHFGQHNQLWMYDVLAHEAMQLLHDASFSPGQYLHLIDTEQASEWERILLEYWQGHRDASALLAATQNRCQSMEATFYSAIKDAHQGQFATAIDKLQQVRESRLYSFSEYDMAQHLIAQFEAKLAQKAAQDVTPTEVAHAH